MATAKKAKLNKNARAWVKALRSGKYKQTKEALTRINPDTGEIVGNCCLGVACELAVKAGVQLDPYPSGDTLYYGTENTVLPPAVQKWLGVEDGEGGLKYGGKDTSLAVLNDGGKSFKQIARIIEQKAAELFV